MPATFLIAPQWQGSGSARAMRLIDGAEAIRGTFPASASLLIDVPSGAGSDFGTGVARLSAVQYVRDEMRATLVDVAAPAITIGGDCGVVLGAIDHANANDDLAVVWFDAHGDLNTAETSPSAAFGGMVLRTLLGDGPAEVLPAAPLRTDRVILAGARALDDGESDYITATGMRMLPPEHLDPPSLTAALAAVTAAAVYLHIDLDVLDPAEFACVGEPEPFGIGVAALLDLIAAARAALPLAGASVTGFAPRSADAAADDIPTILRIIGALTKPLPSPAG